MSTIFDAVTAIAYSGATQVTINHTASGINRLALACLPRSPDTCDITSITYGGSNMTQQVDHAVVARGQRSSIHSFVAPAISSQAMVANFDEASYGYGAVVSVKKAHQTTPVPFTATGSGTTTTASLTITSAPGHLVLDALKAYSPTTDTAGANQTEAFGGQDGSFNERGSGSTENGEASITMSWTYDSIDAGAGWVGCAVSIAPDDPILTITNRRGNLTLNLARQPTIPFFL